MSDDPTLTDLHKALTQANGRLASLLTATTQAPALLHPMLDLIDALDAALRTKLPVRSARGLKAAIRQAEASLRPFGLEPIVPESTFDPAEHTAVLAKKAPSADKAGTVAMVHKRGWRQLADPPRVLRYAEVTVYSESAS